MQVLALQKPFSLKVSLLELGSFGKDAKISLEKAYPLNLSNIGRVALTVEGEYGRKAKRPVRVHVRGSADGYEYDSIDLFTLDLPLRLGQLCRKTFDIDTNVKFIKVIAENPDEAETVSNLKITATLSEIEE